MLLGLAAGDAAGWPAARHRAARMPEWTRRLTRELDTFAEQNATTTLPVPIALNQPPEPLRLGPSDDAEWAAFAARTVLAAAADHAPGLSPGHRMRDAIDRSWNALAAKVAAASARAPEVESAVLPLRARISVRAGLGNLAAGLRPPATGHDNPHYFDDAACVRAAVLRPAAPGPDLRAGRTRQSGRGPAPARHRPRQSALLRRRGLRAGGRARGRASRRPGGGGRAADHAPGLSPGHRMRDAIDRSWNALAAKVAAASARAPEVESAVLPLRARISVRAGLGNLAAGLRPPATGHDNPHYFDDAACVRAAVLAVVHPGDPAAAAGLAEFDARYTQDGDGVHGARAVAAALAEALAGSDVDTAVNAALEQLPEGTEIARNAVHAVRLAREFADGPAGAFALVPVLEHQIVDHVYSYGIAAAETVPVALALATAARGEFAQAVPAAACLSRVADSAPALAGALTGALGGTATVPAGWREACRTLAGCALPRLAGTDLIELAGLLAATEPVTPGGQFRHGTQNIRTARGRHDHHDAHPG
nr:ADP-ribosylglycohydrolase family protein [Streptomyces sp. wa22]